MPAEFQPHHPFQTAETQLNRGRVRLLGFFETAGNQFWTQIPEHRAKRGEIHGLQAWGGVHLEHWMGQGDFLLC